MLSNKMTFSLTSLVMLFAFGQHLFRALRYGRDDGHRDKV